MENHSFTFRFKNFGIGAIFFCSVFLITFAASHSTIDSLMAGLDSNDNIGRSISRNPLFYKKYDVLFLGDSRSHQGLDSKTFNASYLELTGHKITSYNAARPGMQSPFFYFIIKDYLTQSQHTPKAVVVNASFYMLWGSVWLKNIYLNYYRPKKWQIMEALKGLPLHYTAQWALKSTIPLIRYRKRINDMSKALLTNPESFFENLKKVKVRGKELIEEKRLGYLTRPGERAKEKAVDRFCTFNKGMEQDLYLNYMKQFFDLAKKHNFKIFVYGFPWPEKCNQEPTFNQVRQYYYDKIKEVAKGNSNIHFIEYPNYWPLENFADPLHVNHMGAQKLTKEMVQQIDHIAPALTEISTKSENTH